jgi:glycosyltransferase involved in cell wall biosynthesis
MRKCIDSLLIGGEDVEILIVDDGSTDDTAAIADSYAQQYPTIVRAIHKENGGHGSAVNTGIENATGLFFKVVDSDDWVREMAYRKILLTLSNFAEGSVTLDMLISNFVYNKVGEKHHKVVRYNKMCPVEEVFTWKDIRMIDITKNRFFLMHSVIFRTRLLKECGLRLPEHTFYVDNLYVYEPLPFVRNMYYIDVNFYYYFIGREDQSVHENVMIGRIDQQIRVNKMMVDYYAENGSLMNSSRQLRKYMFNYLDLITCVSSILMVYSGTKEHLAVRDELWDYIRNKNKRLYMKLRSGILGTVTHLPGRFGRGITVGSYKIFQKIYKFN